MVADRAALSRQVISKISTATVITLELTVLRRVADVGVVDKRRRPGLQSLEAASELAPEDVLGGVCIRHHVA